MIQWFRNLFGQKEIDDAMKYLVVGMGNMHPDYDSTRHNIGFELADKLAVENEVKFEHENLGDLGTFKYKGRTIWLLKPSTYMNRSGKSVKYWIDKKKIKQENILILIDDLNLKFGDVRLRPKGSHGGHNGLKDIDQYLGNNNYSRLRMGIGNDYKRGQQVDFVLGKWDKEEQEELPTILDKATKKMQEFIFNRKPAGRN
jgi:PTH1 family peptidyl-tRNA hydrolase